MWNRVKYLRRCTETSIEVAVYAWAHQRAERKASWIAHVQGTDFVSWGCSADREGPPKSWEMEYHNCRETYQLIERSCPNSEIKGGEVVPWTCHSGTLRNETWLFCDVVPNQPAPWNPRARKFTAWWATLAAGNRIREIIEEEDQWTVVLW